MYVQNQDMYIQNQDMYIQNQDMYVQNQGVYVQNQGVYAQQNIRMFRTKLFFLKKKSLLRIIKQSITFSDTSFQSI